MKLSIVVPTFNRPDLLKDTIENIVDVCDWIDYELIIIDDCPDDSESFEEYSFMYEHLDSNRIRYFKNETNLWVTKSWNIWVKLSEWEYICIINNDVIFPKWFFEKLMDWFTDGVGMTNPRFTEWNPKTVWKIKAFYWWISWHCFMIKKDNKDNFFPLDERLIIFWSDNWLQMRIREMWYKIKIIHDAICHHLKSQTVFFIPNKDSRMFAKICNEEWWNYIVVTPTTKDILHDIEY